MTYCVGICVQDGLIFLSDSRTNAGVDHINTYSKMHVFAGDQRFLVLLASGNLATAQGVVARIEREIKENAVPSLASTSSIEEAAEHVGKALVHEQDKFTGNRSEKDFNPEATFILGGQIGSESPGLVHIYPEGNFIHAGESTPFLQAGEVKYGKPILAETSLQSAVMCGLVSMDSTMRSNATVGPPIEYLIYIRDTHVAALHRSLDEDDDYLLNLRRSWAQNLRTAFETLPQAPGLDQIAASTNIDVLRR